jgi:hypothetical protein
MIQQQAATPAGWTQQFIGAPTGSATDPDIKLHAVSCVTGFSCAAVGEFSLADATSRPMLARLSAGGGLGFDTGPVPPGAADELVSDVTCATASACAAVGTHSNSAPSPLLENLIGVTWSAQVAPTPTGGTSSFLEQVAAEERTAVGVGRFTDSSGHTQGLITVDIPLT